jgi:hypothetical protein
MMLIHIPAMPPPEGAQQADGRSAGERPDGALRRTAGETRDGNRDRTLVVSYSHTGNNDALAGNLAKALGADHRRIVERRARTMGTILLDMALKREPRTDFDPVGIDEYEFVLVVGPVWMGQIAAPLRAWLRTLRATTVEFGFLSICGGADGPNPGLAADLERRVGRRPAAVVELHIADLLPPEPAPERKDTMAYRLTEGDVRELAATAAQALAEITTLRSRA